MNNAELKKFIEDFLKDVLKYPLMFGGSLEGVESVWHTIMAFESFADGHVWLDKDDAWNLAYDSDFR